MDSDGVHETVTTVFTHVHHQVNEQRRTATR